jgi:hypothetical protein
MERWPDFFIVGAPRAGTTTLYHWLRGHPDIFMPGVKEPHFFTQIEPALAARWASVIGRPISDETEYLSLFRQAGEGQLIGEATPYYLWHPKAPQRIREKSPQARIIAILREPADRAYSHYLLYLETGWEKRSFERAVREDYGLPRRDMGTSLLYVDLGLYHDQVSRYLETFGPEQVRVYLYEDLSRPRELMQDVCAFLGIPFHDGRFFDPRERYNVYIPRPWLLRLWSSSHRLRYLALSLLPQRLAEVARTRLTRKLEAPDKPPPDPRGLRFVRDACRDDVLRLQRLIRRDLGHWLDP